MGDANVRRGGGWVFVLAVASGACSESESYGDSNRPATFTQTCEIGDDTCANPFECLENPERTGRMCTLSCSIDDECPSWEATGHCAGFTQSRCHNGVCQYGCK